MGCSEHYCRADPAPEGQRRPTTPRPLDALGSSPLGWLGIAHVNSHSRRMSGDAEGFEYKRLFRTKRCRYRSRRRFGAGQVAPLSKGRPTARGISACRRVAVRRCSAGVVVSVVVRTGVNSRMSERVAWVPLRAKLLVEAR